MVSVGVVGAQRLEVGYGRPSFARMGVIEKGIDDRRAGPTTEDSGDDQENGCAAYPASVHADPI